jgi:hypothetical protein
MKEFLTKTKGRSISAIDLLDENEEGEGTGTHGEDSDVDMDDGGPDLRSVPLPP